MKSRGYLLLIGGFLAAAYSTALHTQLTDWTYFVPAAIAGIVGVFLIKTHARGHARSETVLSANRTELRESLGNIVRALEQLRNDSVSMSSTELRHAIDEKLRNDLRRFADARDSMVHLYGLEAYADIMSDFAAGERYVNRVWSAAADDYQAEADSYIHKALAQFRDAAERLGAAGRKVAST
ncbi:MAG: hypothetical protein ACE5OQ_17105 [Woeseia sp.]